MWKAEHGFWIGPGRKVTDISGRGVGMDVVKRNIESLRGSVTVRSTLHKVFHNHAPQSKRENIVVVSFATILSKNQLTEHGGGCECSD